MSDTITKRNTISAEGVRAAAARLAGTAIRTPLMENTRLNEIAGGRVFLKAEVLQLGGAFKFRGAYNLISQLSREERKNGVIAWSSGNHAQGVARAAKMFDMAATIVMPKDAPRVKADAVAALGADIVCYDRYKDDREALAEAIMVDRGMVLAPSFDHPDIIEGQGTAALETLEQLRERGVNELDTFVVCCGGGGLTSGCATILEADSPKTEVWIAEPEGFAEAWASIKSGKRQTADVTQSTICDAIATPTPGKLTLPIMERLVRGGVELTEREVRAAIKFAFEHLKIVVEPGGAVALAAIIAGKIPTQGRITAATLSGGNIDATLFADILNDA